VDEIVLINEPVKSQGHLDSLAASTASRNGGSKRSSLLNRRKGLTVLEVWPILLITFLIGVYFVGRYAGHWTENDTASMAEAIRSVSQSGQMIPGEGFLYSNGYAYQIISTFLLDMTGLEAASLQQIVLPFGIVLLAVPVSLFLFEITASKPGAVLGSIFLFTQPEFLFVVLRGSHEKFGRLFMVLALFLLFRSFKSQEVMSFFAAYVALFYLTVYGQLSSNFLIGFSFIVALAFGLAAGAILESRFVHIGNITRATTWRLAISTLTCFVIAFILVFYLYPPAQYDLYVLDGILAKIRGLTLGIETTNIYPRVLVAWINPYVYFLINLANWLVILASFPLWCWQGCMWLIKKQSPRSQAVWLLWLLYGAFGFQAVIAILSDASGLFGNLQHRLFPSFVLLAVAIVTDALSHQAIKWQIFRLTRIAMGITVFVLATFSLIKSTNEASLVIYWSFYTTPELKAMQWFDHSIEGASLWAGFTGRLPEAMRLVQGESTANNTIYFRDQGAIKPYFLISGPVAQQSAFMLQMLPDSSGENKIFDNGSSQIYKRRPRTPYQH
jgi:hypothetical protein